jgi:hypothetical protein
VCSGKLSTCRPCLLSGLYVCVLAMGYFITWRLSIVPPGSTIFQAGGPLITTFFVLTLSTNLYCTSKPISHDSGMSLFLTILLGLIVYRIWSSNRSVASYHQSSLIPVILAVVESAALYSSALLALLISYALTSNGQYPGVDTMMPLIVSRVSTLISLGNSTSDD